MLSVIKVPIQTLAYAYASWIAASEDQEVKRLLLGTIDYIFGQ